MRFTFKVTTVSSVNKRCQKLFGGTLDIVSTNGAIYNVPTSPKWKEHFFRGGGDEN
jgi:hypothetical protein